MEPWASCLLAKALSCTPWRYFLDHNEAYWSRKLRDVHAFPGEVMGWFQRLFTWHVQISRSLQHLAPDTWVVKIMGTLHFHHKQNMLSVCWWWRWGKVGKGQGWDCLLHITLGSYVTSSVSHKFTQHLAACTTDSSMDFGWKSKTQVLAELVFSEASLLGLQVATISLCPCVCFPVHTHLWCLNVSKSLLLEERQSHWT